MKFCGIIKRIIDFFLSLTALLVLRPILIIIGIIIKIDSKGPVLFKQKRIGKQKKEFYILKFRTIRCDPPKDMPTHMLKNTEGYITKSSKVLRSTSLGELSTKDKARLDGEYVKMMCFCD